LHTFKTLTEIHDVFLDLVPQKSTLC